MRDLPVGVVIRQRGGLDGCQLVEQLRRKILLFCLGGNRWSSIRVGLRLGMLWVLGAGVSHESKSAKGSQDEITATGCLVHGRWSVYLNGGVGKKSSSIVRGRNVVLPQSRIG